jgi:hypothetical protein
VKFPALQVANKFELTLVVSEIKRVKEIKKTLIKIG